MVEQDSSKRTVETAAPVPFLPEGRDRHRPARRSHRAHGRHWRGAAALAFAIAVVLTNAPAAWARAVGESLTAPRPSLAAGPSPSSSLHQDLSGTLPVLQRYQAVGDFLGQGHDQRAVVEGDKVNIYAAPQYGGGLLQSVPTDFQPVPAWGTEELGLSALFIPADQVFWQQPCGLFKKCGWLDRAREFGLNSVQIASHDNSIYLAGAHVWKGRRSWYSELDVASFSNKLPLCLKLTCAGAKHAVVIPADNPVYVDKINHKSRRIVVTSLAVGVVGGQTYIAVGLSDQGMYIFNSSLQQVAHIVDMAYDGYQTPVITLAFGPPTGPGQGGLLAGGVMSPGPIAFVWHLNPDGTEKSMVHADDGGGGTEVNYNVLAATFGRINGKEVAIFGRSTGGLFTVEPGSGKILTRYDPSGVGPVTGLTTVTPWDGEAGNQDIVVGRKDGTKDQAVQYVDGVLKPLPIAVNEDKAIDAGTNDQLDLWYPGYRAGRLQVTNHSATAVSVSMASRPGKQYGCWLNTSVANGSTAFPSDPTPLAAGQTSPSFFVGALTAGPDGACASAEAAGEWSSYLVVTPAGDVPDQRLVKLQAGAAGTLTVDRQVGGDLNVTLSRAGRGGSWGGWDLVVSGPPLPTALAAPTLTGLRLTSAPGPGFEPPAGPMADDPRRPVYRFDVSGAKWKGIGAPGQVTAQLPAMMAQGSADGAHWADLGELMPVTAPTRQGDTVTLGPASFFWQDAPGAAPLTEVRVVSGGLVSNVVHLAGLVAPPIGGGAGAVTVQGLKVTPTSGSGMATPVANGVDQAVLRVELIPSSGGGLVPVNDPRYQLVYYRYRGTNQLVTGLYSKDAGGGYSLGVAIGPLAGAYPTNGQSEAGNPSSGNSHDNYLVTTTTNVQTVYGDLNDSGTAKAMESGDVTVQGAGPLTANPGVTYATKGLSITGCASQGGTCPLANPKPQAGDPACCAALYQAGIAGGGPVVGLQLAAVAVTAEGSLPLAINPGQAHGLGSAELAFDPTKATLQSTAGFWPSDAIDTALVSSGSLVLLRSVQVSAS
jgi:hypothetical protein